MADEDQGLFAFPCVFPLKIMGIANNELPLAVADLVRRHAPDFDDASMSVRFSSAGKYMSLGCTITATSRSQLDALYGDLCSHPLVKFVL